VVFATEVFLLAHTGA